MATSKVAPSGSGVSKVSVTASPSGSLTLTLSSLSTPAVTWNTSTAEMEGRPFAETYEGGDLYKISGSDDILIIFFYLKHSENLASKLYETPTRDNQ